MTIERITVERALNALAEAVAEKGEDYAYAGFDEDDPRSDTCLYVYEGAPSCIVGDALHRLGVPLSDFAPYEGKMIDEVAGTVDWPIDFAAVDALYQAQNEQDGGAPWGKALDAARRAVSDGTV